MSTNPPRPPLTAVNGTHRPAGQRPVLVAHLHRVHAAEPPAPVQTPAPAPHTRHPDERLSEAVRAAYEAGAASAQAQLYRQGWRYGFLCGALAACVGAGLATAAGFAARTWGWL